MNIDLLRYAAVLHIEHWNDKKNIGRKGFIHFVENYYFSSSNQNSDPVCSLMLNLTLILT